MSHPVSVAGVPLPSNAVWFLALIAVHVAAGVVAVVAGAVAMLSAKRAGRHPRSGNIYFWSLAVVCTTMAAVVIYRWPVDNPLAFLGAIAMVTAVAGRRARRRARPGWECVHIPCMGISYIALITAFYVDNGPHLPFWNKLPLLALWLFPSVIGLPLLGFAWWKRCPPSRRAPKPRALDPAT